jgi:hypothetical protein
MSDTTTTTVALDNLVAGDFPIKDDYGTLAQSQTALRGWVLGEITVAMGSVTPGTNTGDGTLTGEALAAGGPAKVGNYVATCVIAAANSGTFNVVDPDGVLVGQAVVGTAFSGGGLTFTINDGAVDFVVGDSFTVAIDAGSGQLKHLDITATDGSNKFWGILSTATTTAAAETRSVPVMRTGEFDAASLIFGGSTTAADVKDDMESKNAYQITLAAKVGA